MSGKYQLIYCDPPWQYKDKANDGDRGAGHKYPVMNLADLKRLPVHTLAAESCLLAMWWVPPMPKEALALVEAWGFRFMTMKGFSWHKVHAKSGKTCLGMGHMTRGNSEDVLFAVKGKLPPRMDASISQWLETDAGTFTAARGEHSQKPNEVRLALEKLLGECNRIELFSRGKYPGWDTWGNECELSVNLTVGRFEQADDTGRPADWDEDLDGPWQSDEL